MKRTLTAFALSGMLFAAEPNKTMYFGSGASRTASYGKNSLIEVRTHLRWATEVVLPDSEKIINVICGDAENWTTQYTPNSNFVVLKPQLSGSATNLVIFTSSGNHYRFVLKESDLSPDSAVQIALNDDAMQKATDGAPKFVPAEQINEYRLAADRASAEMEELKAKMAEQSTSDHDAFRASYPKSLDFAYKFNREKQPFNISSVWHDSKFTYIRCDPQEVGSVYELKDSKPSLVLSRYENGMYVIPKIVRLGYLAVGKQKAEFSYEGAN